jgi:hypothetical protein
MMNYFIAQNGFPFTINALQMQKAKYVELSDEEQESLDKNSEGIVVILNENDDIVLGKEIKTQQPSYESPTMCKNDYQPPKLIGENDYQPQELIGENDYQPQELIGENDDIVLGKEIKTQQPSYESPTMCKNDYQPPKLIGENDYQPKPHLWQLGSGDVSLRKQAMEYNKKSKNKEITKNTEVIMQPENQEGNLLEKFIDWLNNLF